MTKTDELKIPERPFIIGQHVYISEQYYGDNNATYLEVPRFGWLVKSVLEKYATIEYQRQNLKLLMTLLIDTKYLKREI